MLKVTIAFLVMLAFSAAAFDKNASSNTVGQMSGTMVSQSADSSSRYTR